MTKFISISDIMEQSGVKFGTSGARGLAIDMTDRVCFAYTLAFIQHLEQRGEIKNGVVFAIGGDLRPSTERIMVATAQAVLHRGYKVVNAGLLPSPALALYGIEHKIPTIMVTGSHIPDDRNGIKYTKIDGEILKQDEESIRHQRVLLPDSQFDQEGRLLRPFKLPAPDPIVAQAYMERYSMFFGADALKGMKVGVYQHSAVGRDMLVTLLEGLGARTIALGRSAHFIPVDTEAIRQEDIELAARWAAEHEIDAIVSTDGDGDRPLIADENGILFRGDVIGIICARLLGADTVVTPVTSNSAVEKCGSFQRVIRTKVGSPFVIEAMREAELAVAKLVCGYEANGGFLVGNDIWHLERTLRALPTRDAVIAIVGVLLAAKESGMPVSRLTGTIPSRFTHSDRLKNFPTAISQAKVRSFAIGSLKEQMMTLERVFKSHFGAVADVDHTDGCRIYFANGDIIHLRPSGNAPEFRCYAESDRQEKAIDAVSRAMEIMKTWI